MMGPYTLILVVTPYQPQLYTQSIELMANMEGEGRRRARGQRTHARRE